MSPLGSIDRLRALRDRLALGAAALIVLLAGTLLPASTAQAAVAIESFNNVPGLTQAGGHPDLLTTFTLSSHDSILDPCACNDAKDVTAHLPTGLIGNPHATPQCSIALFSADQCPTDSQVGVSWAAVAFAEGANRFANQAFLAPVYNLIPPPNEPGLLAFKAGLTDTPTFEDIGARTDSDYGLNVKAVSIEHFAPLTGYKQLTWGVPADPANNNFRFAFRQKPIFLLALGAHENAFCDANGVLSSDLVPASVVRFCPLAGEDVPAVGELNDLLQREEEGPGFPIPSNSPRIPFIQNPTTCGTSSFTTFLEVLSYDTTTSLAESSWPATTDCAQLSFNPSQSIAPTTTAADSPSGAEFRLTIPQFESPSVPSPSELRAARVTLPKGFSFAPNVTNGKETCSDAQARFGTTEEAHCPENAKIGTISVETPVLPGVLPGAVYLGEPKPGNRFRLILAFDGFGVHVKLAGTATPDPATGQIVVYFNDLPQAPFSYFNAHFFGSERGALDTPTQCGTYEITNEWTPWDSALSNQVSHQFFTIDQGPNGSPCPNGARPFHPGFQAASTASTAGAHTDFSLNLTRGDGEQNLKAVRVSTPPGFSATLKGVTYCPDAAIAAAALESHSGLQEQANPSCPASSLVGELVTGAGPGTHPLYLPGKVYLAGPYAGAPLSFVFIVPAVSAGYDLGNVVVREGIDVNSETAQVSTAGGPLPQIFQGIPLRLRQIFVNLNRPGFALNPTNCEPLSVTAQVFGDESAISDPAQHFQVANCASLPFGPKLSLRLTGSTKQAGNPALTATLTAKPGEANISRTQVTLPRTELIDNAHINSPCTRVQFAEGHDPGEKCPPGSVLGFARAETPLLDKPLEGPVYLRTTGKAGLPDIVAALNGQIDIALDGHVDSVSGRLRTTFQTVPDAPVTKFTLSLDGGHKGLLENSPELCSAPRHVRVQIIGQNGKTAGQSRPLQIPCRKRHEKHRHQHSSPQDHR